MHKLMWFRLVVPFGAVGSTPIPDATRFGNWLRPVHGGKWLNQSVRSQTWAI